MSSRPSTHNSWCPHSSPPEQTLIQSPAIIEWLEEKYPTRPAARRCRRPRQRRGRAGRDLDLDIHPINNRRILEYIRKTSCQRRRDQRLVWHLDQRRIRCVRALSAADKNRCRFSYGDAPTIADCDSVPQIQERSPLQGGLEPLAADHGRRSRLQRVASLHEAAPSAQPDAA